MEIYEKHDICLRCMNPLNGEGRCPKCGFDAEQYKPKEHHLKPRTILHGQYIIGCVLGEGGFGITYVGWDLLLHMMVAVKEYFPVGVVMRDNTENTVSVFSGADEEFFRHDRGKFMNEAQKLAKFDDSPGVVSVKNYFMENGTAYIVMEYIQGINLSVFAQQNGGKLSMQQALKLLDLPMRTLSELHKAKTFHRDISPENLMVTNNGVVKLIDFGSAMDHNVDMKTRTLKVRPGYSPIELYTTEGKEGTYTDIYALCATIYKTITGVVPPMAFERMTEDKLVPPSKLGAKGITPRQEKALLKGLAVNSASRYQSVEDLYKDLKSDTAPKPQLSGKMILTVLLVIVLLVGGVVGFSIFQNAGAINFASSEFEAMLLEALGKPSRGRVKPEDLAEIDELYIYGDSISLEAPESDFMYLPIQDTEATPLTDLQHFPALTNLYLNSSGYTDEFVAPVGDMTGLTTLCVMSDSITSLNFVSNLTGLENLGFAGIGISDLTPLQRLANLTELHFTDTAVSDLTPLSSLDGLFRLLAPDNRISDWSPVKHVQVCIGEGLQNRIVEFSSQEFKAMVNGALHRTPNADVFENDLRTVHSVIIHNNEMSFDWDWDNLPDPNSRVPVDPIPLDDLQLFPALENLHLGIEGYTSEHLNALKFLQEYTSWFNLILASNTIDSIDVLADLPHLRSLSLYSDSITDISVLSRNNDIQHLNIQAFRVTDFSALSGMYSLLSLDINANRIDSLNFLTDLRQLEWLGLWTYENCADMDWSLAAQLGIPEVHSNYGPVDLTPVLFSSPEFEAKLRQAKGWNEDMPLYGENLRGISEMWIINDEIIIGGVENWPHLNDDGLNVDVPAIPIDDCYLFPELNALRLINNNYTDEMLMPLHGMHNITSLNVVSNGMTNADFLYDLNANNQLNQLCLQSNNLVDLEPLRAMTNVQYLELWGEKIVNLEPVSGMTRLKEFYFDSTSVSDLSPLSGISSLLRLYAWNNKIVDWSPVSNVPYIEGQASQNVNIEFTSREFERMLRRALGREDNDPIRLNELQHIESLTIAGETMLINEFTTIDTGYDVPLDDIWMFYNLKELSLGLHDVEDDHLEPLSRLPQLAKLNIWLANPRYDMTLYPLGALTNLEELTISVDSIASVEFAATMPNLKYLFIQNGRINDISGLAGCALLEELVINGHWNVEGELNLSPLSGLANLRRINLEHMGIADLSPLSGMRSLRSLDIISPLIKTLEPLRGMRFDEGLYIQSSFIKDWSPVRDYIEEGTIPMDPQPVQFTSPEFEAMLRRCFRLTDDELIYDSQLAGVHALTIANGEMIGGCQYNHEWYYNAGSDDYGKAVPLDDLRLFPNLHHLSLHVPHNEDASLQVLGELKRLMSLYLSGDKITSLEMLRGLPDLHWLTLAGKGITDLSALEGKDLYMFHLRCSPIKSIEVLRSMPNLEDVYIGECPKIKDLSPIDHVPFARVE